MMALLLLVLSGRDKMTLLMVFFILSFVKV